VTGIVSWRVNRSISETGATRRVALFGRRAVLVPKLLPFGTADLTVLTKA
jgi:hypothetical protein